MTPFSDPVAVSSYAERTARIVPGLRDLHRMAGVLLAERATADAHILVLGAGGGLELKAFAEMQPGWHLDGVDPAAEDQAQDQRLFRGCRTARDHPAGGLRDGGARGVGRHLLFVIPGRECNERARNP